MCLDAWSTSCMHGCKSGMSCIMPCCRSLLSLVGLGSVSDYCIHNLHTPVIVVRSDTHVEEMSSKVGQV